MIRSFQLSHSEESLLFPGWITVPHEGIDFRGSDIGFELMDDAESCQRACTADAFCQFYTYVTSDFSHSSFRYILLFWVQTVLFATLHSKFLWLIVNDAIVFAVSLKAALLPQAHPQHSRPAQSDQTEQRRVRFHKEKL